MNTTPDEKSEMNFILFLSLLKNKKIIVNNKIQKIDNKSIKSWKNNMFKKIEYIYKDSKNKFNDQLHQKRYLEYQ